MDKAVSPLAEAEPKGRPRLWRVGTLSYTSGALAGLFGLLLLGDIAWSLRDRSVGPMAQWYLSQLNTSSVVFGLLMTSFPSLVSLILGPIISVRSDRHRGKWGRRIPYLLLTTPFATLGMFGLAITPWISQWLQGYLPGLNSTVASLVCFAIFWAAFEFAIIASQAVFGGLINDVVPAALIGRFYGLFRAVSLIVGIFFYFGIFGKISTHFTMILLVVGVFYAIAFIGVCLKVREGEYPPPPPPPPASDRHGIFPRFIREVRGYFRECFGNSYYVLVFVMLMGAALTFMPVNTFSIPFAHSLGVSEELYGKSLALTFGISLVLAYFLGWLCDVFHPLRMTLGCIAAYLSLTVYGSIWVTTPAAFLIAWVLHGVISGCFFTCCASLGQRLYPHAKYAQFASAAGIVGSIAGMVTGPAVGAALDASGSVYRYTYAMAGVFALATLVTGSVVYSKFLRLGGPDGYVAPN